MPVIPIVYIFPFFCAEEDLHGEVGVRGEEGREGRGEKGRGGKKGGRFAWEAGWEEEGGRGYNEG